jgi:hypothetical protein
MKQRVTKAHKAIAGSTMNRSMIRKIGENAPRARRIIEDYLKPFESSAKIAMNGEYSGLRYTDNHFHLGPGNSINGVPVDVYLMRGETRAFAVYGAILDRYNALGGPSSWLGAPRSDEMVFLQNGRTNAFTHGAIYWWPDVGAIDRGNIGLEYTGFHCFGETNWDQGSSEDEPYFIFGTLDTHAKLQTVHSDIYENTNAGESWTDSILMYDGRPTDVSLNITLMENDFGSPDQVTDIVRGRLNEVGQYLISAGTMAANILIPGSGPVANYLLEAVWPEVRNRFGGIAESVLNLQDDQLGNGQMFLAAKDLIRAAHDQDGFVDDIPWQWESPLFTGEGSSYKAFFRSIDRGPY